VLPFCFLSASFLLPSCILLFTSSMLLFQPLPPLLLPQPPYRGSYAIFSRYYFPYHASLLEEFFRVNPISFVSIVLCPLLLSSLLFSNTPYFHPFPSQQSNTTYADFYGDLGFDLRFLELLLWRSCVTSMSTALSHAYSTAQLMSLVIQLPN
jgi:hypothetical protein